MHSRLGLAATRAKTYLETVWVRVAASTLTTVFLLQQDDDKPSFFEMIGRIFEAFSKVVQLWPSGNEVNGLTLIIQVFSVADLLGVGEKIDAFFLKTLDVPRLLVSSSYFQVLLVFTTAPMLLFGTLNIVRYIRAYSLETSTSRGEDRVHAGKSRILDIGPWFLTRFLVWMVIGPGFYLFVAYVFSYAWNGVLTVLEIFYTGTSSTMGSVWIQIIQGMLTGSTGKVVVEFLLMFIVIIIGGSYLAITFIKRLVDFIWASPKFQWDSTKILRGLRDVTLAKPGRAYLEKWLLLALTVFFVGLLAWITALLSYVLPGWPIAFTFGVCIYLVKWLPKYILEHRPEEFYHGIQETFEDFFAPEHGLPTPIELEAQDSQRLRGGKSRFSRPARAVTEIYKDLEPEHYRETQQVTESLRRLRPRRGKVSSGFTDILEHRGSLDVDPATGNAMLAWLRDQYEVETPSSSPEEMIDAARKAVRNIRRSNPEVYENMVERGEDL